MTSNAALALAVPAFLAVASGCGASVQVEHWTGAAIDIDGARHVVVTDAFGRDDSIDAINGIVVDHLRSEPWFSSVQDATRADRLETDGVDAWLRHGEMERGTLYVRFDVLEDLAVVTADERVVEHEDGTVEVFIDETASAHTLLSVTVADADGVLVDELEYEGISEAVGPVDDYVLDTVLADAAHAAVAAAVAEIAPTRHVTSVPLDERDEAIMARVRPAIDASPMVQLDVADSLATVSGPSALYNRAVLTEAAGDLVAAVELYRAAARAPGAFARAAEVLNDAEYRLQDARHLGLIR